MRRFWSFELTHCCAFCVWILKELQERVRVERPVGERRDLPVGRRGVRAQGL